MAITVGPAAHKAVQAQSQQAQGKSAKSQTQARHQPERESRSATVLKAALTPALKQAAQLAAGPVGEVAVKMAAGAVGALLDTKA